MKHVHLCVRGLVQGVGFRYHAKAEAERLGITGWIRNVSDGSVEVVGCGEPEGVNAFIEWCEKGPRQANVTNVERLSDVETCQLQEFQIFPDS